MDLCGCEGSHVFIGNNIRPPFSQNLAGVFFNFTKGGGFDPSLLKPKSKAANAAEQVQGFQFLGHSGTNSTNNRPPLAGIQKTTVGALKLLSSTPSASAMPSKIALQAEMTLSASGLFAVRGWTSRRIFIRPSGVGTLVASVAV
jgi:hypothetical protein